MTFFLNLIKKSVGKIFGLLDELYLRATIKHIHGPKKIEYSKNEVVVICLVCESEFFIKSFIEHHFSLGVKHIVFLDNVSRDNTVSIARKYKNISIFSSNIFFGAEGLARNEFTRAVFVKHYLANRFCKGRWALFADVDELFDYPFSDTVKLSSLLDYLNQNSYTAVIAHTLDMFSDRPISEQEEIGKDSLKKAGRYYDITNIRKNDYYFRPFWMDPKKNILSNKELKFYTGGIRKTIFGEDLWLTKHPLIFIEKVKITSAHCVDNVRCADFSAVCFHYKLLGDFHKRILRYLQLGRIKKGFSIYAYYVKMAEKCEKDGIPAFKSGTAVMLDSVNDLVKNGFLTVSNNYLELVSRCAKKSGTG